MPLQSRKFHQAGPPSAPERCSWDEWVHTEHGPSTQERGAVLLYEGILHSGSDERQKICHENIVALSKDIKALLEQFFQVAWNHSVISGVRFDK